MKLKYSSSTVMYTCTHTYSHAYTRMYGRARAHTRTRACTHAPTRTRIHVCMCTCTHMHMHTYYTCTNIGKLEHKNATGSYLLNITYLSFVSFQTKQNLKEREKILPHFYRNHDCTYDVFQFFNFLGFSNE